MSLLLVVGVILILLIIYWFIKYYHFFGGVLTIPRSPYTLPILGDVLQISRPDNVFWDIHLMSVVLGKYYATRCTVGFFFGICVVDPDFLEHILTSSKTIDKGIVYKFNHNWLGTGLLNSGGAKWRARRKLLTPAYHFQILEKFIEVFERNGTILVGKLQMEVGREYTDVYPFINLYALDVICETAMGTTINAQIDAESKIVNATKEATRIFMARSTNLLKHLNFLYQFTGDYRKEKAALHILHSFTLEMIAARRKVIDNETNELKNDGDVKKKIPFLDLLLASSMNGAVLSDDDIREEVDTFMFEGHDTVSSGMSFTLYCISKHPHVQEKLISEQRAIFGDAPHRDATHADLQHMKYLEMVIKESLRLYPPVPVFGRNATEDFTYRDHHIRRQTEIFICVYTLHRNPAIWPEPETFDPERFTTEAQAKRHPFAYLPFSAGFRNCIGQKFAMLEMKSTVSRVLRNFELREAFGHDVCLRSEIILTSANGINVELVNRVW